jgi:predicted nucleotidyltransferase
MVVMRDLRPDLEAICRRVGVASLYLYGSRAREITARLEGGGARPGRENSDLDVAVQPAAGRLESPRSRVALAQALEGFFEVPRVDLVILPEADSFLAADAVRGELVFCDDEDRQAREELYYLRRAADLVPYQRVRLAGILSGELRR